MMARAMRVCSTTGCVDLTKAGQTKCSTCRRGADRKRGNPAQRGYDARWQATRRAYLARYPYCVDCAAEGKMVRATDVDHLDNLGPHGPRGYDWSNFAARCHAHHSSRTARESGGFGRVTADGKPIAE